MTKQQQTIVAIIALLDSNAIIIAASIKNEAQNVA
jgi:hypothetical protein